MESLNYASSSDTRRSRGGFTAAILGGTGCAMIALRLVVFNGQLTHIEPLDSISTVCAWLAIPVTLSAAIIGFVAAINSRDRRRLSLIAAVVSLCVFLFWTYLVLDSISRI